MSSASCNTGCQSVAPFTDWLRCQSLPGPDGTIPPRQAGTALLHPWSGGGCTHTLVGPPHRIVDGVQIWLFSGHAAYRIRTARFLNEWYMWQYELHPPHLINVATLPCESQNTKNVVLQQDITKENCITYIIASSKWTRAIMCLKFTYLACMKHRRPVKMLDANLFWLWPERHQCWHDHLRSCVHVDGGHFECMLWPECSFIRFTRTFYETVNVIWCM